ncbi:MAG: aspartyl protease family protein [Candidatus Methylomirabilales bacterium]
MSDIYLTLTIANFKDPERQRKISFLIDTGATRAWISEEIAEAVGVEPAGTVPLELADSSVTERPYGFCLFIYNGEAVAGNVVIGPPGCEPLVGTHVLQDFRLIVDLERHEVIRGRAMRAKRANPPDLNLSLSDCA